jgi:hypothetical protein
MRRTGLRIRITAWKELSFKGRAGMPPCRCQSHFSIGEEVRSATMISLQKWHRAKMPVSMVSRHIRFFLDLWRVAISAPTSQRFLSSTEASPYEAANPD